MSHPIAILAQVYYAMYRGGGAPGLDNYDYGTRTDFFRAPVHDLVPTGELGYPWPFIPKDFLAPNGRLTDFPHHPKGLAETRYRPVTFFYEVTALLETGNMQQGLVTQNFAAASARFFDYYATSRQSAGKSAAAEGLARRMFLETYGYLLGYLLRQRQVEKQAFMAAGHAVWSGVEDPNYRASEEQAVVFLKRTYDVFTKRSEKVYEFPTTKGLNYSHLPRPIPDYKEKLKLYVPHYLKRASTIDFGRSRASNRLRFTDEREAGISIEDRHWVTTAVINLRNGRMVPLMCLFCAAAEQALVAGQSTQGISGATPPLGPSAVSRLDPAANEEHAMSNDEQAASAQRVSEARGYARSEAAKLADGGRRFEPSATAWDVREADAVAAGTPAHGVASFPVPACVVSFSATGEQEGEETPPPWTVLGSVHVALPVADDRMEGVESLDFRFVNDEGAELPFIWIDSYDDGDAPSEDAREVYYFMPERGAQLPAGYPACGAFALAFPSAQRAEIVVVLLASSTASAQ